MSAWHRAVASMTIAMTHGGAAAMAVKKDFEPGQKPVEGHKCCRVPRADHSVNQQGRAFERLVVSAGLFRRRNGEQMGRDRGEGIFRIRQPIAGKRGPG